MIRLSKADDVKAAVLNNGDIIVKYGGDYVHCYHGGDDVRGYILATQLRRNN